MTPDAPALAVLAMLAVGNGAQDSITGSISGIGTNLLFVFQGNEGGSVRNAQPLTLQDAEALSDPFAAPSVQDVSPVLQTNSEVTYGGEVTTYEHHWGAALVFFRAEHQGDGRGRC